MSWRRQEERWEDRDRRSGSHDRQRDRYERERVRYDGRDRREPRERIDREQRERFDREPRERFEREPRERIDREPRERFEREPRERFERESREGFEREREIRDVREPRHDRERERGADHPLTRDRERDRDREGRYDRDRSDRGRDRERDDRYRREHLERSRERRRSPRRYEEDVPNAPSPPKISRERSRSPTLHINSNTDQEQITIDMDDEAPAVDSQDLIAHNLDTETLVSEITSASASPGDWLCKCGSYNFKRRNACFRRNCFGRKSEGSIYGGKPGSVSLRISKKLIFKKLDALTTEEDILDCLKERCSKDVIDKICGITIGREPLTGASKCLAYINFNSIADSTEAFTELTALRPPLVINQRHVVISYYYYDNKTPPKQVQGVDYSSYYQSNPMSETDRVNAAAAVAQSAMAAAQARAWAPTTVTRPTPTAAPALKAPPPTGDGKTVYSAPDVRTFLYDETSGYYYDPATGLYYDGTTQYFYNNQIDKYMYWDAATNTYKAASQTQQNTDQPRLPAPPDATADNTIPDEKKKKDKDDKVKVAKKIAKDMERWARTLNQKKENAKNNLVMEQPIDTSASIGSADIGFSVLGAGPALAREPTPPPRSELFLSKEPQTLPPEPQDNDDGIIDWSKLTCLLCKRRFPSFDVLTKHKLMSDLHKQNLAEFQRKNELLPQLNGYRDRAAERRMKFGEESEPIMRKRYDHVESVPQTIPFQPPPSVVDTIGGKMLQKMGWSEGRGLGKEEQGRVAPIEAEQRPGLAGLGQKRGIYTPTPGETYRDTVKKLMIARYKEVVGQEDD